MPYTSDKQRRWAHTPTGKKALGGAGAVKEWDDASRGMKLPEQAKTEKCMGKGDLLDGPPPSEMDELVKPTKKPVLKPRKPEPKAKQPLTKENLMLALEKAGYRESALLLKNWGEEDENAKKLRKQLDGLANMNPLLWD